MFWLHLRQEIYNAYLYQRSVVTDLTNTSLESKPDSLDDMWFHQILVICAQVTKWAFGSEEPQPRWYELCNVLNAWETERPDTFNPLYFRKDDPQEGRYFPEVCYATDEHVLAAQFYYLTRILLTTHDPSIPRIGPRMKSAIAVMQSTVLSYVRTIIGIAAYNQLVCARFYATLAIMICDSLFTDLQEQEALLEFLRESSTHSGWAREDAHRRLVEVWG